MPDMTLSCSCCGSLLTFAEDASIRVCPACGTHNARPRSTDNTLTTLQRAISQRLACDFHNAEMSYQQVLLMNPDEHEALWGLLLCRYGVEYVEDPATGRLLPTVHAVQAKPLQEQPDFRRACDFAPDAVRAQYAQDAAYIDEAQSKIRQLSQSFPPYDVFLCHKTTRPGSSDKTEDFHRATQLYHFLKDQGVRAFFAPECLQSAAGANYEAGIYHALYTAKVMLVLCSDADYLTSPWVRSEWTRFLETADAAPGKQLVPLLYDHFSPSALPAPFRLRKLQGLDMTDINAPQRLLDIIAAAQAGADEPPAPEKPAADAKSTLPVPAAKAAASAGDVVFEFPRLIPEWKRAPAWKVCIDDKKNTVLTPVKWTKTVLCPLQEPVSLTVREDRVSKWWPLLVVLGAYLAMMVGGLATIPIGCAGVFVTTPLFLVWYIRRIRAHRRKRLTFTAEPGRRYRLRWDEQDQLQVDTLGD